MGRPNRSPSASRKSEGLTAHRLALFTAFAGFLLIIAGGLVTSTGSGLSVPDWPLSYGSLFPPMVGGIRFEHGHRMIAAGVGLLTFILMVRLLIKAPSRPVRRLGAAAFGLVLFQGILGGITVLWQLPLLISVAHACLGQISFAAMAALAQVTSPRWRNAEQPSLNMAPSGSLRRGGLLTVGAIGAQLILGALLRHAGWRPHLLGAHLVMAFGSAFLIVATATEILRTHRREPWLLRPALALKGLLLLQIILGLITWVRGREPVAATAHVAGGALLLAVSVVLALRLHASFPRKRESTRSVVLEIPNRGPDPRFREDDIWNGVPAYLALTKPRLTALAVVAALIGFLLGSTGRPDAPTLLFLLVGTALLGAGASALNQYWEREPDARMSRTRQRPIPSGQLAPGSAAAFGLASSSAGLILLTFGANPLAGALGLATLGIYLLLYTPLKPRTALCTLVGAIPGALPPVIGWAAARGGIGLEALLLFAILFLWQMPHFLALGWEFRDDYERAGFRILPVLDPEGRRTFRQIALYCAALVPVSLMPALLGSAGFLYFFGALAAGTAFLGMGLATAQSRSAQAAHRLFAASLLYLPFLLVTLTVDKALS